MKRFIAFFIGLCCATVNASAVDLNTVLQKTYVSCVGISDKLDEMKKLAGINTAVTGVGTVVGGGALIAGIEKAKLMEKLYDIEENLEEDYVQSDEKMTIKYNPNFKPNLKKSKTKQLGNWRTGLLAVNTATNVAGAVIASKNLNTDKILEDSVQECVNAIDDLQKSIAAANFEKQDTAEAKAIYDACADWKYLDLSVIKKRTKGAQVASIVGGGAGAVGIITSALANNAKTVDKEKGLDSASNVFAGGATLLSGGATVFNAMQIAAIKKIVNVAQQCEGALK